MIWIQRDCSNTGSMKDTFVTIRAIFELCTPGQRTKLQSAVRLQLIPRPTGLIR
jgi:hypothetical protein